MTHSRALRGGFPRWRADARLLSDRLRPAWRQGVTERALLGPALEHGGGHKIILPRMAVLSHRIVIGEDAELWQTRAPPTVRKRPDAREIRDTTIATAVSHRPIGLVHQCVSYPRAFLRQDPGDHDPRPARRYFRQGA